MEELLDTPRVVLLEDAVADIVEDVVAVLFDDIVGYVVGDSVGDTVGDTVGDAAVGTAVDTAVDNVFVVDTVVAELAVETDTCGVGLKSCEGCGIKPLRGATFHSL